MRARSLERPAQETRCSIWFSKLISRLIRSLSKGRNLLFLNPKLQLLLLVFNQTTRSSSKISSRHQALQPSISLKSAQCQLVAHRIMYGKTWLRLSMLLLLWHLLMQRLRTGSSLSNSKLYWVRKNRDLQLVLDREASVVEQLLSNTKLSQIYLNGKTWFQGWHFSLELSLINKLLNNKPWTTSASHRLDFPFLMKGADENPSTKLKFKMPE